MKARLLLTLPLFLLVTEGPAISATRHFICKNSTTNAIAVRENRCKRGETKITNYSSLQGQAGTNGINGTDGTLRVYGDGSGGALTVSGSVTLSNENLQATNITINSGSTLYVPSGTVLRCTGTFTNNGTIDVGQHALGGVASNASVTVHGTAPSIVPAAAGASLNHASQGAFGTNGNTLAGGLAGHGFTWNSAAAPRQMYRLGPNGGGGGGSGITVTGGGAGGGTLTVLCSGAVINNGTILAQGDNGDVGSGGGAGGIVILASKTSVTNSAAGVINVSGGAGGVSNANNGAGGGGGGGMVRMISVAAPSNSGTVTATGGIAGSNAISVTGSPRIAGAGGGSCYGGGGGGSSVSAGNVSSGNAAGEDGALLTDTVDPTSLF